MRILIRLGLPLIFIALFGASPAKAQDARGASVLVVYNSAMEESREVAEHYAERRGVPASQVIGLALPKGEEITRDIFVNQLQRPLFREIQERGLITYASGGELGREKVEPRISSARIRYLVLCYGVPVKIARDGRMREDGTDTLPAELQGRNEAAVDSELALLPLLPARLPANGPLSNPFYGATNVAQLSATNGLLMTARLDGPTAALAKGLVDKAMLAEKEGLWGRAYFDLRGINDAAYKLGDELIQKASEAARHYGYETVVDRASGTFPAGFPMADVALYFGWYDQSISGPFKSGMAEFVPGAIAYHLHSFSASVLRTADSFWTGPLVAKGATATIGFVYEPYLQFTPDLPVLLGRMLFGGFSFGEAAYTAQQFVSWQATVVGDPLYTPNLISPQQRFVRAVNARGPELPWAQILVINRNLAMNTPPAEVIEYLSELKELPESALLQEKLGELYKKQGMVFEAAEPYLKAFKLESAPLRQLHLVLAAGRMLSTLGHREEVMAMYERILRELPNYPDRTTIYQFLAEDAAALNQEEDAIRYRRLAGEARGR